MDWTTLLDNFHFLRPQWLLLLLVLPLLVWLLRRHNLQQSGWSGILPNHLYQHLVSNKGGKTARPPWTLLLLSWVLVSFALAGPTWERLPQPVYQVSQGKVIVMDMSLSMRATDVTPDRLARSKFKAIDLANQLGEGELGLVAYAGDAFVISPLTSDVQNVTSLIPSLSPEIMPLRGSEPEFGLEKAFELLSNAGYQSGDIFWITDGVELSQIAPLRNLFSAHNFRINILGVGTEDGAPIKLQNGDFMKDFRGAIVVPQLRKSNLQTLARSGGGKYVDLQPTDADIQYLTEIDPFEQDLAEQEADDNFGDQWKEMGPYLLLLLLPIAAYSFRRGILILAGVSLLHWPSPVSANWWDNLWQRPDQQGMKSYNSENYSQAAQQFEDPMWRGAAHYREGDYESAAAAYAELDSDDSNYNLGNALAQSQKLQEAIAAYERALELNPDHEDAAANKKLLEDLLEQQQSGQDQNQDENQDQNQDQSQENQEQNEQNQNNEQQNSEQDSEGQESQEQDSQQDPQDSQQQNSDQNDSQQQQEPQDQQSDSQQQDQSEQQQNADEQQESEAQQSQKPSDEQNQQNEAQQQAAAEERELTEEEKEQLQKMQKLLRKIPDDPAYLLKRKMQLEQERRKRQRIPSRESKDW